MHRTRLERKDGSSVDYWDVASHGSTCVISYGRDGHQLGSTEQEFDLPSPCIANIQRHIGAQLRKGFENVSPNASSLWRALKARDKAFDVLGALEAGADPNEMYEAVSVFELALHCRRDEIPLALFDRGAQASVLAPESLNLIWAVGTGRVDVVQAFLDAGADTGIITPLGTPLSYAAKNGEADMVAMLIGANAELNTGSCMCSPLFEALNKGHEQIAIRLIEAGACLNLPTEYSRRLLDYAIIRSFPQVVEGLVAGGCDLETRNTYEKGKRPTNLAHLVAANRNISVKEASADIFQTHHFVRKKMDSVTPLLVAIYQDEPECIEILLQHGAKAKVCDGNGITAIQLATRMQRKKIVPQLTDALASAQPSKPAMRNNSAHNASDARVSLDICARIDEHVSGRVASGLEIATTPPIQDLIDHYNYETVIERLCDSCRNETFQRSISAVADICKSKRRDRTGEFGGYDFQVSHGTLSLEMLQALQQRLLRLGAFVYCFRRGALWETPGALRVIPTSDRYDALVVQRTSAHNYDMGTEDIIAWFRTREPINPFSILWVEHDKIEGSFLEPIQNADELAASMYEFCEDIVDQGVDSVEALATNLRASQRMYFWWD